jgi:hypothetical protein
MSTEFKPDAKDGDGDGVVQDGTEFERPIGDGYKPDATDGDGDGKVQDGTKFERPVGETAVVAAAEEPEPKPEPKPKSKPAPKKRRDPSPAGAAVSGNETDNVSLAACVFKNKAAKKSLSIHHVQRRLTELGYPDAYTDKDGWYGDLTLAAVAQYQSDEGLDGEGVITMETLESLFADDCNVTVVN